MKKSSFAVTVIILAGLLLYLANQTKSIYGGDGGDLVTAALVGGIPHPPGYPLYTFLGFLLTRISLFTPAYRVGFLSSISSILTLIVFFMILKLFVKNQLIALVTVLTLGTTYLFWLYSIVPEVFALNNLFTVLLIYLFINFLKKKNIKYLYLWFLVFGLGLTHHHTILLILPASVYFIYKNKKLLNIKYTVGCFLLFTLGLIPYIYLPIAASFSPALNWDNPQTLPNFIHLVTRAGYGTFKIGNYVGDTIIQRGLSLLAAFKYLFYDFRLLGSFFILLGFYLALKKKEETYRYIILLFFTSILFIIYASFPLSNDFLVGTFERFLLFPEILLSILLALGIEVFAQKLKKLPLLSKLPLNIYYSIFLVIPLGLFILNNPKLSILSQDDLPEKMATDILNTVEPNSVLIASTDTTLFSLFYVYHWKKDWSQVKLIHSSKLNYPDYRSDLKVSYPDLYFPQEDSKTFLKDFFEENAKRTPFYSMEPLTGLEGDWIPFGLTLRYFPKDQQMPDSEAVTARNNKLWDQYSDPLAGSLKVYKNLLMSDILRVYSIGRETYGLYLLDNKKYDLAEEQIRASLDISSFFLDTHISLGKALLYQNKCQEALSEFMIVYNSNKNLLDTPLLISQTYSDCFKNEEKKKEFLEIYDRLLKEEQTSLEKL